MGGYETDQANDPGSVSDTEGSYATITDEESRIEPLRCLLLNRILEIHSAGSLATFGNLQNFTLPGISVTVY